MSPFLTDFAINLTSFLNCAITFSDYRVCMEKNKLAWRLFHFCQTLKMSDYMLGRDRVHSTTLLKLLKGGFTILWAKREWKNFTVVLIIRQWFLCILASSVYWHMSVQIRMLNTIDVKSKESKNRNSNKENYTLDLHFIGHFHILKVALLVHFWNLKIIALVTKLSVQWKSKGIAKLP